MVLDFDHWFEEYLKALALAHSNNISNGIIIRFLVGRCSIDIIHFGIRRDVNVIGACFLEIVKRYICMGLSVAIQIVTS